MAIKALVDPRRRLLQQKANVQNGGEINPPIIPTKAGPNGKKNVIPQKGGVNQGSTATPGSKSFSVIPKRNIQGVPNAKLGKDVIDETSMVQDKPNIYSPKPADLATVAEQMRVAREKGDYGTLNELTNNQYVPQLEKAQTSISNVNTAQVSRLLGDSKPVPATMEEQRVELTALAKQLQTARETGDLGTANQLAQRYRTLTDALQKSVTGQPVNASDGTSLLQKAATAQTATGETTGGVPGSTVPSGETDASVTQPPAGQPAPAFDASSAYAERLSNPGLILTGPMGNQIPDPAGAQKIQQAIDYDNNFLKNLPPNVANQPGASDWWNRKVQEEAAFFNKELAQYPDQYDKIFANHQKRLNELNGQWQSVGQWEGQLNEYLAKAPPETQVKIKALNEQQKNEFLQSAIADMQNGVDVLSKVDGYLAKYGADPNFQLGKPGFEITDKTMGEFKPGEDPTVAGPDNVDLTTDKSRIDAALAQSSISEEGKKALGLQLETIQKRLSQGGGGFSEQELQNMAAPLLQQIEQEKQAAINSAKFELAAQGKATGGSYNSTIQDITAKYANQKKEAVMALVRENMAYKQQGTTDAINALGGISESERQAGLTEKGLALEGATTTTTLTSKEKEAQAQANFQQKALFQEGNLTVWGQKTQRDLDVYGMKLDQYQTDKGFDIDRLKIDLQEREIQMGATIEAAKMKADKVAKSIEEAGKEADRYDRRTAQIADLRQRMAAGDQDAGYRVQALEVQQELSQMGLANDVTTRAMQIIYQVRAQGLELNQEWKMFIEKLAATKEAQESGGFMEFAGSVLGSFAGGLGGKIGGSLFK